MQDPTGRYSNAETAFVQRRDGTMIAYLRHRIISPPAVSGSAQTATRQGERLDLLSQRTLGDPLQYWRICDANTILDPHELTATSGRLLFVPIAGS